MTGQSTGSVERIAVGQCKTCGYVIGDDVDFRFPQPARCSCGSDLMSATVTDAETVQSLQSGSDQEGRR